jgi:hypothetical protein
MPTTSAKERWNLAVGVEAGTTGSGEDGDDEGLTTTSLVEAETGDEGKGVIDEAAAG